MKLAFFTFRPSFHDPPSLLPVFLQVLPPPFLPSRSCSWILARAYLADLVVGQARLFIGLFCGSQEHALRWLHLESHVLLPRRMSGLATCPPTTVMLLTLVTKPLRCFPKTTLKDRMWHSGAQRKRMNMLE